MPYYRITIFLRNNNTVRGIRSYENTNIDAVTNIARVKARQHYGDCNVIDIEAAMLSNHCTAVIDYRERQQQIRENKKYYSSTVEPVKNRKSYTGNSITLGERKDNESNHTNPTIGFTDHDRSEEI